MNPFAAQLANLEAIMGIITVAFASMLRWTELPLELSRQLLQDSEALGTTGPRQHRPWLPLLKQSVLRAFLDGNNVTYARSDAAQTQPQTAADVGSEASKFTGIVGCYKS